MNTSFIFPIGRFLTSCRWTVVVLMIVTSLSITACRENDVPAQSQSLYVAPSILPDTALLRRVPDSLRVVLCSNPSMPWTGHAGSDSGWGESLARAALGGSGWIIEYVNRPWTVCLEDLRRGAIHGLVGADSTEIPGIVVPRVALGETHWGLFALSNRDQPITDTAELTSLRVGHIRGQAHCPSLDSWLEANPAWPDNVLPGQAFAVGGSDALSRLLALLEAGRLDVIVGDRAVLLAHLAVNPLRADGIEVVGSPCPPTRRFLAFSPLDPRAARLAANFDRGFDSLRRGGELELIARRLGVRTSDFGL